MAGKNPKKRFQARKGLKARPKNQATQADRHELYQRAVQCPEMDIAIFDKIFEELRGRKALHLREDFCGTAHLSVQWCQSDEKRRATGIDLDEPTLQWGREHNLDPEPESLRSRVDLQCADVLEAEADPADIICAMNFSYFVFKQRQQLAEYLAATHRGLAEDGILILELYGGTEAMEEVEDERELDGVDYIWEQETFDPLTHETLCHIHFSFPDGSRMRRAFTYDWRLWTAPELRDLLEEAGFSRVRMYVEKMEEDLDDDEDDDEDAMLEGTGEYEELASMEQQTSWLAYVVAER